MTQTPRKSTDTHGYSRRTFLRGAGTAMALPLLESLPSVAQAAGEAARPPLRAAFLAVPDGMNMEHWRVHGKGRDFQFGQTLSPLEHLKNKLQVLTGLSHHNAFALGDGGGDHARANAVFLTGARPLKTAGADFRNGISVDQIAAEQIGDRTRIPSLQLGADHARMSGNCDSGYCCAYQFNLSWASPTMPLAPEVNPRALFEQLFGSGSPAERQNSYLSRQQSRRSILDFISADTRQLSSRLGTKDRHKLDEYLSSVRTVEKQIESAEQFPLPPTELEPPQGIPQDYQDHLRLMFDLLALSFQTDSTRLATFLMAHEGSNRNFPNLGISEGHHDLSHHQGKPDNLKKIARIDYFYVQQFTYFLHKLDAMKEVDGSSVLDNSMIVYGCAISDGNSHSHNDLPIVLAGGGGGTLNPGRHVELGETVPMTNLFVSMLDRLGVEAEQVGDSTGRVSDI